MRWLRPALHCARSFSASTVATARRAHITAFSMQPRTSQSGTVVQGESSANHTSAHTASGALGGLKILLVVGVALLDVQPGAPPKVLLAQRPPGKANAGQYEFPGGKVEAGETPEAALVRELQEELGITVELKSLKPLTFASFSYPAFHLLMPLYVCSEWSGTPQGAEGQSIIFVTADQLCKYSLTLADVPLVPAVMEAMKVKCL